MKACLFNKPTFFIHILFLKLVETQITGKGSQNVKDLMLGGGLLVYSFDTVNVGCGIRYVRLCVV